MATLTKEVAMLLQEADNITRSKKPTPADKQRLSYLLARVASIRSASGNGDGFSATQDFRRVEDRAKLVRAWSQIARGELISEVRANQASGQGTITGSTTGEGGAFVPVEFLFSELQIALAAHDPLFDSDKVTLVKTNSGNTLELPLVSDISEFAAPVTEAFSDTTRSNLALVGNIENNTFMYRTPKIATSMEFGEDSFADFHVTVLENQFSERIARGVGRDMISGNSAGHIKGIIPSLQSLGVNYVTAAGSADNTGGDETGANSIGSDDLANLYFSVNSAYRNSPKAAWLMNDRTLLYIASLKDKMGRPLNLVTFIGTQGYILGKPVYVSPSMPDISVSAQGVVIFGDLSRWVTRQVAGANYIKRYTETQGLIENGLIGWSCFARYGGSLLATDPSASPLNYISNHS